MFFVAFAAIRLQPLAANRDGRLLIAGHHGEQIEAAISIDFDRDAMLDAEHAARARHARQTTRD